MTQAVEILKSLLDRIGAFTKDSLANRDLGPQMNFEENLPRYDVTLSLYRELSASDLQLLPNQVVATISEIATKTLQHFEEISKFSIERSGDAAVRSRNQLIAWFRDEHYGRVFSALTPILGYARLKAIDIESLPEQAKNAAARIQRIEEEAKKKSEDILSTLRQAVAEAGVLKQTVYFEREAAGHEKKAIRWLIASITFLASVLGLLIWVLVVPSTSSPSPPPTTPSMAPSTTQVIHFLLTRLAIVSVLVSAAIWCARNYSVNRHNYVINRHRLNCMRSFRAFLKAAADRETRDSILVQVTSAIFAPQRSGYSKAEVDAPQPTSFLGLLREMKSTAGGKE